MILHTSAIVFKSVDFQESSKIVTLFTEEQGKIAVIAKGAKRPKNKLSGIIEPVNLLDVVYYHKDSRSVQILTEASLLHKNRRLRTDFEKMAIATSAIEMVNQLVHEGEVNHPLFEFTKNFLIWLNDTDQQVHNIFPYLQVRLADLTGLGIQLELPERPEETSYYLDLESGSISPRSDSSYCYKLSQNQFAYVSLALQARSSRLLEIPFSNGELKHLVSLMDRYFKYHIDSYRDRKSDAIFEQIMQE